MRFVEPIIGLKDHKMSKSRTSNDFNDSFVMTIYENC